MRPLSTEPSVILSVRLDPEMLAAIQRQAHFEFRSASALVREALLQYFCSVGKDSV